MATHTLCTICPVTGLALYVSDVKPGLLVRGARGDWGYSTKYEQAARLTDAQYKAALSDMRANGRRIAFAAHH